MAMNNEKQYEWVEISNPKFNCPFYANPITGECTWSKPMDESTVKPIDPEGDWWQLWDEKNKLHYYYHTRANISQWVYPTDTNVISLVKIQPSEEFAKQMSSLIKQQNAIEQSSISLFPTSVQEQQEKNASLDLSINTTTTSSSSLSNSASTSTTSTSSLSVNSNNSSHRQPTTAIDNDSKNNSNITTSTIQAANQTIPVENTELLDRHPEEQEGDSFSSPVSPTSQQFATISSSTASSPTTTHINNGSSLLFNFGLGASKRDKDTSLPSRNQSLCSINLQKEPSTEINRSRRGSHFSAFSNFTTKSTKSTSNIITNPLKHLLSPSKSSSPPHSQQRYSVNQVRSPINNPEAAAAMHPLNQIDPMDSNIMTSSSITTANSNYNSPNATLRNPMLPMGLQQEINKFAIDGFAQKYFSTHKRGLFRRRVPMNEMLKWTKDSIKQPLIMLNKELYKDALKCFKLIQMVMGDRPRKSHHQGNDIEDIQSILTCGITKGQMRDEIYVQTCKQLHNNPNGSSIKKGWEILCIISVTFPPSKNLEAYLTNFVQQNHSVKENHVDVMSQHVSTKLKRVCIRGAKGKVLTAAEINRAKEAPFKPSVFGESLAFIMDLQRNTGETKLQIPQIVPFLAKTVRETNGQFSEGIFRVPGDADAVTDLRVRIENGNYDATGITDPNVPASLLKYWLRDLADPIIVSEDYNDCIKYSEDPEKAIAIINGLPDTNRRIALFTISFLQEFTDPATIKHTLMNVNNLAMVFAPNFLRCPSESLTTVFENSKYEQAFLRTLINEMVVDPETCVYDLDGSKAIGIIKSE